VRVREALILLGPLETYIHALELRVLQRDITGELKIGKYIQNLKLLIEKEGKTKFLKSNCRGKVNPLNSTVLWDGVDWVDLAQDRDHWRALVNTVMNLQVP
jgi:hypothetical protein